jgi:hypothetical protein
LVLSKSYIRFNALFNECSALGAEGDVAFVVVGACLALVPVQRERRRSAVAAAVAAAATKRS